MEAEDDNIYSSIVSTHTVMQGRADVGARREEGEREGGANATEKRGGGVSGARGLGKNLEPSSSEIERGAGHPAVASRAEQGDAAGETTPPGTFQQVLAPL